MSNSSFADFQNFFTCWVSMHQKRYIRANQKNFMGKELNQAIMGSRGKNCKFLTLLILAVDIFKYSLSLYFILYFEYFILYSFVLRLIVFWNWFAFECFAHLVAWCFQTFDYFCKHVPTKLLISLYSNLLHRFQDLWTFTVINSVNRYLLALQ